MWCIEAKAKIDIPLGENVSDWTNQEFKKAIDWLEERNYREAVRDCQNKTWLDWLKRNTPKDSGLIKEGQKITVTKGKNEKFALWHNSGIWDLPEEYVGDTIRVISQN